jgi:hypothetical protein
MLGGKLQAVGLTALKGWRDYIVEKKRKREVQLKQDEMKQNMSQSLKAAVQRFLGSSEAGLVRAVFGGWKHAWVEKKDARLHDMENAMGDFRLKALMNARQGVDMHHYWMNMYITKQAFSNWKDITLKACWRNSLAKWRDNMTSMVTNTISVGDESAQPTKVEKKLGCAELEIKALRDALLAAHGLTQDDFSDELALKEWLDGVVGFSTQMSAPKPASAAPSRAGSKPVTPLEDADAAVGSGSGSGVSRQASNASRLAGDAFDPPARKSTSGRRGSKVVRVIG